MADSPPAADRPLRDHGFHPVAVSRVIRETDDARSFVLDVPDALRESFTYRAGQFCTFKVQVDGATYLRCYSMSSAPELDDDLTVTVKRVPGGVVSNWLIDRVNPGDVVDVTLPAGVFQLTPSTAELVTFAAGSGITPIISLVRSALATTDRDVALLYANRSEADTIFLDELALLEERSGGRLRIEHRRDDEHGYLDAESVRAFVGDLGATAEIYVCGPTPFMDVVEQSLLDGDVDPARIHIERFVAPDDGPADDTAGDATGDTADDATGDTTDDTTAPSTIVIEVDGRTGTTEHRSGTTVLQAARQLGLDPPYSCESGSCATCMARLVEGTVTMHVNDALTDAEVEEGWVLTCQSVPTAPTVHVVYGFD